jgi:hypothetical protein
MHPTIETYRDVYAKDLEERLDLNSTKLPPALAVSTLLNPMFGLMSKIVGSGLMKDETQYNMARSSVIRMMQDVLDDAVTVAIDSGSSDSNDDSSEDDDCLPSAENSNYNKANNEFQEFKDYKRKKYLPTLKKSEQHLKGEFNGRAKEIWVGAVSERGKDLPSGKNISDYIDEGTGRMKLLVFFEDHKKQFPTLWVIVQREASHCVTEVGCKLFFNLSGYISSPQRTRLEVRTYERLAMLASIMQVVYIDPEWVACEYMRRTRAGVWKAADNEALKCFNLERILDAETQGHLEPPELTMEDLLRELDGESDE